jgi:hypothetical protein
MMSHDCYPYPPRPGVGLEFAELDDLVQTEALAAAETQATLAFEHQLYQGKLDPAQFPKATKYLGEQAELGHPVPAFEAIWQKKANTTTLGLQYYSTAAGRQQLRELTGHELQAQSPDEVAQELSSLTIATIASEKLDKLEAASVGHEEAQATEAFIAGSFSGNNVPEPRFLTIHKNPAVILEKARGYRQLKMYYRAVLRDLQDEAEDSSGVTEAKRFITQLYRRRINGFIASNNVAAYIFAHQAKLSTQPEHQALLTELESVVPVLFSSSNAEDASRVLVRMDRYNHGVARDENGDFTWLSQEAAALADQTTSKPTPVDRDLYQDLDPTLLATTKITGATFGAWLRDIVQSYNLLSEQTEWSSERQGPASDGKWQVVVDAKFKSLAVNDKQRVLKVPAKETTLLQGIAVGNHEITHIFQNHNKRLIGSLALMQRIDIENISEQAESGGLWQEREARQLLTGVQAVDVNGTGYLAALRAKADGQPFGAVVKAYYEDLRLRNPNEEPTKMAAQAVNRVRRIYRSGGFEYAQQLPRLTNTQPLNYLEQGLIYQNLPSEHRQLLFIGGVSIANLVKLSQVGLVDIHKMFIPKRMPWELLHDKVAALLAA